MKVELSVIVVMHGDPIYRCGSGICEGLGLARLTVGDLISIEVVATQHRPQLGHSGGLSERADVSIVLLGGELRNSRNLICAQFTTIKCFDGDRQLRRTPSDTYKVGGTSGRDTGFPCDPMLRGPNAKPLPCLTFQHRGNERNETRMGNVQRAARFGNLPFELDHVIASHLSIVHTFD